MKNHTNQLRILSLPWVGLAILACGAERDFAPDTTDPLSTGAVATTAAPGVSGMPSSMATLSAVPAMSTAPGVIPTQMMTAGLPTTVGMSSSAPALTSAAPTPSNPTPMDSAVEPPVPSVGMSSEPPGSAMPSTVEPQPTMTAGPEPTGDTNPSGYPEPGAGGTARPSGAVGGLEVLPWAGYKAAITYSFDDSNSSQINNESQMLGLEVPFTFYMQTGKQEASNAFFQHALDAGHELGNHTQNHGSGSADQDVTSAQSFLMSKYGVTAYTMAAPNGNNSTYNNITAQLFIIDRGVGDGLIGADEASAPANLPTFIPPTGAGTSQLNPKVDAAISAGKWQTLCIHGFQGGSDGAYQAISLDGWVQNVQYAKDKGTIWIGTMQDVGAYWMGRRLIKAATPMSSGDSQTWNWTLPNNFPPGRFVRVTVDGGTLMQDGVALPWNEHGFYEVALDTGTLTLSP